MEKAIQQFCNALTVEDMEAAYNSMVENFAADMDLPDTADFESGVDTMLRERGLPSLQQRYTALRA